MGNYWNYYTLAIPPIGFTFFDQLKPDLKTLGQFNDKYILSPYLITDPNLEFIQKFNNYFLYLNKLFLERVYLTDENSEVEKVKIISYNPNQILVDVSERSKNILVLSQVYSPGWFAYLDDSIKIPLSEKTNALMSVKLLPKTKTVTLKYEPPGLKAGLTISLITIITILLYLFRKKVIKKS